MVLCSMEEGGRRWSDRSGPSSSEQRQPAARCQPARPASQPCKHQLFLSSLKIHQAVSPAREHLLASEANERCGGMRL